MVMSNSFGTKDGKLYEIPGVRTSESASPRENFEFTPDLREISLAGPFLSLGGFRAHGIQFVSEVMRGVGVATLYNGNWENGMKMKSVAIKKNSKLVGLS
uniref:Uncharacterized protein n=1 Tax=Vespula pensylvanica TaxID=30213 RepID=A0A834UBE7_VESPE|nr:hypothetical protein H0235_005549 [Vespula pensylvanica]